MTHYDIENPYLAYLIRREKVSKLPSTKEVYALTFNIKNSSISYACGDSAAIFPSNDPTLVEKTLHFMNASSSTQIFDPRTNKKMDLGLFLREKVTITRFSPYLLRLLSLYQKNPKKKEKLEKLLDPTNKDALSIYVTSYNVWEALKEFNAADIPPQEICSHLSPLLPRLYSISSSQKVHPHEIELLVTALTYQIGGRQRFGVASHFLCHIAEENKTKIPLYIHKSSNFHLPFDSDAALIMIGAGTGIAPFHSFLEERYHTKAKGKNWLFFGEQYREGNYYFESFLTGLKKNNLLRLDTAFSRDQEKKIYVQHLIIQRSKEIWNWIEDGAYIYVCGDARAMAHDVDQALCRIIEEEGKMNESEAKNYLRKLHNEKRYRRDIY